MALHTPLPVTIRRPIRQMTQNIQHVAKCILCDVILIPGYVIASRIYVLVIKP